jgi:hypothetical protein
MIGIIQRRYAHFNGFNVRDHILPRINGHTRHIPDYTFGEQLPLIIQRPSIFISVRVNADAFVSYADYACFQILF